MKTGTTIAIIVVILLVAGGAGYYLMHQKPATSGQTATTSPNGQATTTIAGGPQKVTTPAGISFSYYADVYGLATNPAQVLVKTVIPPCDQGFDYCLYRVGTEYAGTNFESAGLAVKARADLSTKTACLSTQPDGNSGLKVTLSDQPTYSTSAIGPVNDAGAGHYSAGMEYRLWTGTSCTQFDTRIGETQYANYPAGTKVEFSAADERSVNAELKSLLYDVKVNGTRVAFPGV